MRKVLRNRLVLFISLGLATIVGLYLVFGPKGLLHVHRLNQEKKALDQQVQVLEAENERLQQQILRLETDKEYLQKVIRDKLNVIKDDETIILFQEPSEGESK
jgi:cell division protein FtsB